MTGPPAFALECRDVELAYAETTVLHGVDLEVGPGESVALLGPSGSGKSSLLAAIAGLQPIVAGEIRLDGQPASTAGMLVPPERRRLAMVFQHYALWPHLTAIETVAYPLRRAGWRSEAARERAAELLDAMGVGALAARRPAELSGGEQQRVGLARAVARQPSLFLFDEPTAHLDTPLRAALQAELAEQRARTGTAALTATHDVGEALAVADRVALLRDGRIVQVGTPLEVYARPVDVWAARLTGSASLLEAELVGRDGSGAYLVRIGDREGLARVDGVVDLRGPVSLLVRPDWATLGGELPGVVRGLAFRGPHTDLRLDTPVGTVELRVAGPPPASVGDAPGWHLERAWALPAHRL